MLNLSKHFIKNWQDRVGQSPSCKKINKLINQAIRVQKGKQIVGRFGQIKTLTIYWHADEQIIITADHYNKTVVSVYSRANMPGGKFGIGGYLENH